MDPDQVEREDTDSQEPGVKTRKKRAHKGETRKQRFIRLADTRKKATLHDIRLIGNLADRHHYDYTPAQARALIRELRAALEAVEKEFDTALSGQGGLRPRRSRKRT